MEEALELAIEGFDKLVDKKFDDTYDKTLAYKAKRREKKELSKLKKAATGLDPNTKTLDNNDSARRDDPRGLERASSGRSRDSRELKPSTSRNSYGSRDSGYDSSRRASRGSYDRDAKPTTIGPFGNKYLSFLKNPFKSNEKPRASRHDDRRPYPDYRNDRPASSGHYGSRSYNDRRSSRDYYRDRPLSTDVYNSRTHDDRRYPPSSARQASSVYRDRPGNYGRQRTSRYPPSSSPYDRRSDRRDYGDYGPDYRHQYPEAMRDGSLDRSSSRRRRDSDRGYYRS